MAPIPEDKDKPPNDDESEIGNFSNPNLAIPLEPSDSSDDNDDDNIENFEVPGGYSLLPQEPGDDDENEDDEDEDNYNTESVRDGVQQTPASIPSESATAVPIEMLPEAVISSEAGASAPTVHGSQSALHPEFLAKFPDGKIPSYMQVPSLPRDKEGHVWNQKRQDVTKLSLDAAQESKILKAMSGFSLPPESIPDWARNLPDDQWRLQVLNRIGRGSGKEKHSTDSENSHLQQTSHAASSEASSSSTGGDWVAKFPDTDTAKE